VPGVEKVAVSVMPLLRGDMFGSSIAVNGVPSPKLASTLEVTRGWMETMRIPLFDGRDFRDGEHAPNVAIVSKTFAKEYFGDANPIGKTFQMTGSKGLVEVVGLVGDARYQSVREPATPVFYVPFQRMDDKGVLMPIRNGTFIVRGVGDDPQALTQTLRRTVVQGQPEFRVTNVATQTELIDAQTIRERLLASLAVFFGGVALLLAAIGLYGVLHYSVLQREKEIGIRIAVGAQARNIARLVTTRVFAMVMAGAIFGLGLGMATVRYVETLLYGVKGTDPWMLLAPMLVLLAPACLAALPAVMRAVRIDPVIMLRAE
jgi:putative ABC transport system permease protein